MSWAIRITCQEVSSRKTTQQDLKKEKSFTYADNFGSSEAETMSRAVSCEAFRLQHLLFERIPFFAQNPSV